MKKLFLVTALLGIVTLSSCSSGGGSSGEVHLPSALSLASYLQDLVVDLGDGDADNYNAVSSTLNSSDDVLGMIDSFFTFMGDVTIEDGAIRIDTGTSSGTLKADFTRITQVTADINMDGTAETIECSGSATVSACAYLWLDDTPFALLVVTQYASGNDLGMGMVTFLPSRVDDAIDAAVSISAVWGGDGTIRATDAYFVGIIDTDFTSDKGRLKVSYDEGTLKTQESSDWSAHPNSCDATQAALGWVDAGSYISTDFARDDVCDPPVGVKCLITATSAESSSTDDCTVFAVRDSDVMDMPTSATSAELPADFPATPSF